MNLQNVIGRSGNQRRRAEAVNFLIPETKHAFKNVAAKARTGLLSNLGRNVDVADRTNHSNRGNHEHLKTHRPDIINIAFGNAVINHIRSEGRKVHVTDYLNH